MGRIICKSNCVISFCIVLLAGLARVYLRRRLDITLTASRRLETSGPKEEEEGSGAREETQLNQVFKPPCDL